jgi:hypothetical protein
MQEYLPPLLAEEVAATLEQRDRTIRYQKIISLNKSLAEQKLGYR